VSAVFDTEVLLAFYLGEPMGKKVEKYLEEVAKGAIKGYLSIVNLAELYYILYRRSPALADEKERNLRALGLEVVPVEDDELWRMAATIKGRHGLSLADAFAAATAKAKKAKLLAGKDSEYGGIDVVLERLV